MHTYLLLKFFSATLSLVQTPIQSATENVSFFDLPLGPMELS